jgi:O-glycosyl hydrolase
MQPKIRLRYTKLPLRFTVIAQLCLATASLEAVPLRAQTALSIDPQDTRQTFEGWGTSLAWWAYSLGGWKDANLGALADLVADTSTGLGMNVYRYNIGGGDQPGHAHMRIDAAIPGYKPSEAGPYAWRADSLQLRTLKALLKRTRQPVLEAFANSPPWWMTKSGCASGNADASNNLKEDYYGVFADYLTEVVKHLHDSLGLDFRTLEPFNEPNSNWWKAQGKQEGCMFARSTQAKLILEVARSLKSKGLAGTGIAAADANSIAEMSGNLQAYDSAAMAALVQVNTHSYSGADADRRSLRAAATRAGKRLWQSEAGPLNWTGSGQFAVAMWSAALIARDLREMGAEAWIDWQVAGGGIWGVIDYNASAQSCKLNKKGYAYAQFSRFIRPGSIILAGGDSNTVAAYRPATGSLILVAINGRATTADYAFDLSRFAALPASARVYRTSASEDAATVGNAALASRVLKVQLPGNSITTFVMDGAVVAILPPLATQKAARRMGAPSGLWATPAFVSPKGSWFVDAAGRLAPPGSLPQGE